LAEEGNEDVTFVTTKLNLAQKLQKHSQVSKKNFA